MTAPWASSSLLVRGHSHPSYEDGTHDTEKVEREGGERTQEGGGFWAGFLGNISCFGLVILFRWHARVEVHLKSFSDKLSQPPCHLNPAGLSHAVCWKSQSGLNIAPESIGSEAPQQLKPGSPPR